MCGYVCGGQGSTSDVISQGPSALFYEIGSFISLPEVHRINWASWPASPREFCIYPLPLCPSASLAHGPCCSLLSPSAPSSLLPCFLLPALLPLCPSAPLSHCLLGPWPSALLPPASCPSAPLPPSPGLHRIWSTSRIFLFFHIVSGDQIQILMLTW